MEIKPNASQKITPFLWYNDNAEEAMNFYVSLFPDSHIKMISRYGDGAPMPAGTLFTGTMVLAGQEFMVINGGPHYSFTPAVSFFIRCENQQEIDELWEKLSEGGRKDRCGWLQDRFGLSWQVVPVQLEQMLHGSGSNPGAAGRVMQALMQMNKLDIAVLEQAYAGQVTV